MHSEYSKKELFESQFDNLDASGDKWGHRWRGSQKYRYEIYLRNLNEILPSNKKMKILDVGCALGDFTQRVAQLDKKNEIYGMDIAKNAIEYVSNKYPNISFEVGALPNIPFGDESFDLVLCLEVLYYLNKENRIESIKNIHNTLKPGGHLFFSGVLDDGNRYFKEDEIITLLSNYFKDIKMEYNYAKIYTPIERKLLYLVSIMEIIKTISRMPKDEFYKWCDEREERLNAERLKRIRDIVDMIPLCWDSIHYVAELNSFIVRRVLSWKLPVHLSYQFTKFIFGNEGKTQIIILAKRN